MWVRYTVADLVRNPRRTLATVVGVVLGVGLFCGVLFFVDGLSASMTQRAVAPLAIDMQRIVSQRAGAAMTLTQTFAAGEGQDSARVAVEIEIHHAGETPAHEVTLRSIPADGLTYVAGSAQIDGASISDEGANPFARGAAASGYNLGTVEPGATHVLGYLLRRSGDAPVDDSSVATTFSSRESVTPIAANQPAFVALEDLAEQISMLPGVDAAVPLSIADLGSGALRTGAQTTPGQVKIFGFDTTYADRDGTIEILEGALSPDGAVISAEARRSLQIELGDAVTIELPDGSHLGLTVTGFADLSRSRSLFSSRRGGDLETFIYTPYSVVVSPAIFSEVVFPAFERAVAAGTGRLKSPPIREVDVSVERNLLDADPATAVAQSEEIADAVMAIAAHQDYLLDNVTNTLHVAADDAAVAKRLFVFLGVPGVLLAAMLAAYAGNVLADSQRREQATLRIRGADRGLLLRMLALRTAAITAAGAALGLVAGYGGAAAVLGRASLERASAASLVASAVIGTVVGYIAIGTALYLTGRRSIDREINEDRARLAVRPPLWRRARLDLIGAAVIVVGTLWALSARAFDGAPGSVYFGRSVQLRLVLLVLPLAVWITGSLVGGRAVAALLDRTRPASAADLGRVAPSLLRRSVGRRPWAIGNGAIVVALIVALATCLAAFTASYRHAKTEDARYANGADIRITPGPAAERTYGLSDGEVFAVPGVDRTTPVIAGLSNVILRSARTSDPANLVALEPSGFAAVSPLDPGVAELLADLTTADHSILVSAEMARFLQAEPGDTLHVLLARATPDQVDVEFTLIATFERLPGFPTGADAIIDIAAHVAAVPAKSPDFFLADVAGSDDATLEAALAALRTGPAAVDHLQIDSRASTFDSDQSSLAALNLAGLVGLDSGFALAMTIVAIAIFVFGLLLQRRREYVTLRAMGMSPRAIRGLIGAEAATVALGGAGTGLFIGAAMGFYFVAVLRPLFVLNPSYTIPLASVATPVALVAAATLASTVLASRLVNRLEPTELLRDE